MSRVSGRSMATRIASRVSVGTMFVGTVALGTVALGTVALGAGGVGCAANAPDTMGLDSVFMMPEAAATGADSAAASASAAARRTHAATAGAVDTVDALGQTLLMLPFEDASKYKGAWPVHTAMARTLGDSLRRNPFYQVMPVDSVYALLSPEEQRGHIDPRRAAELARFLAADWAVLGHIDKLTMERLQVTVPLGGHRSYEGVVSARLVLVNAIDGRPSGDVTADGFVDSRQTGITNPASFVPFEKQYVFMDDIVWGSDEFRESLVGKAVMQWAQQAALGVADDIRPPPSLAVSQPKIIDLDGTVAYINAGLADGIRNGDKFGVWDRGRELRDPDTGVVLGQALPRRVGVVQVEQVLNDHLTQVRVVNGDELIVVGYSLRAE